MCEEPKNADYIFITHDHYDHFSPEDIVKAAELVNRLRPEVVIPTHYGSIVGKLSDGEMFAKYVEPPVKVEIKIS